MRICLGQFAHLGGRHHGDIDVVVIVENAQVHRIFQNASDKLSGEPVFFGLRRSWPAAMSVQAFCDPADRNMMSGHVLGEGHLIGTYER